MASIEEHEGEVGVGVDATPRKARREVVRKLRGSGVGVDGEGVGVEYVDMEG